MRIGIDIDDTLADTSAYIMPILIEFDKIHVKGRGIVNPRLKHHAAFDWSEEDLFLFRDDYTDCLAINVPIIKDAAKYVKLIKELGNEIIIITARSETHFSDPYSLSKEWLDKNEIPFDELLVSSAKKGEVCTKARIDLFIDDSFGQASYVAENLKIPVLMPVDDYNRNKECEAITKVYSWEEIYNIVKLMIS